jgi:hypothetical protein
MAAALVPHKDAPDEADGLVVLLAAKTGPKIDPVLRLKDTLAGAEVIDAAGVDSVIVVVINTLQEGDSKRPSLCIGTPEEVDACRTALLPEDMNPPGPPPPTPEDDGGCSCDIRARSTSTPLALVPLAAILLARRRRAMTRAAKALATDR